MKLFSQSRSLWPRWFWWPRTWTLHCLGGSTSSTSYACPSLRREERSPRALGSGRLISLSSGYGTHLHSNIPTLVWLDNHRWCGSHCVLEISPLHIRQESFSNCIISLLLSPVIIKPRAIFICYYYYLWGTTDYKWKFSCFNLKNEVRGIILISMGTGCVGIPVQVPYPVVLWCLYSLQPLPLFPLWLHSLWLPQLQLCVNKCSRILAILLFMMQTRSLPEFRVILELSDQLGHQESSVDHKSALAGLISLEEFQTWEDIQTLEESPTWAEDSGDLL